MGGDVADVALGVADHARNALQHAEAVVAVNGEFYGIGGRSAFITGPLDINTAFGFVEEVGNVGTIHRVHGHALAACDVADDALTADGIATSRAVDQHVTLSADGNRIVIPKNSADYAGNATRLRGQALGFDVP